MKKLLIFGLAATGMVLASCSKDADFDGIVPDGTPVEVNFSAVLPDDLSSRAYGDGTTASALKYAVYNAAGTTKLLEGTGDFAGTTHANVTIRLVTGESYKIYFWAQNAAAPYTFDTNTLEVSANYSGTVNNLEALDAFYTAKDYTCSGSPNAEATLKRVTAQLNIATGDKSSVVSMGKYPAQSSVSISKVPNKLDLRTGYVSGEENVTFSLANLPTGSIIVNEKTYDYLSMCYLLASETGNIFSTVNMKLDSYPAENYSYTNIPVKRNYKTNIVGDLLTTKTQWSVTIDPIFTQPSYDNETVVSTESAFLEAFSSPVMSKITVTQDLDLTSVSAEDLTFTTDKTLVLENDAVITLPDLVCFSSVSSNLTIIGGTITNAAAGTTYSTRATDLTRKAKSLIEIKNGDLMLDGVELINDPEHHWHGPTTNSAAVAYWGHCNITIKNSRIISGEFTVCGMGRGGVNTSYVLLQDSYFESTSSSRDNGSHWAYAMRLFGTGGLLKNCEVKGIHGALSTEEGEFTVDGGKYYTVNSPGKTDAFYAVYATNASKVIIHDGEFYTPNCHTSLSIGGTSCVTSGDNDTGKPIGTFVEIRGGKFSGKAYISNRVCDEFEWVECTDPENPLIKWTSTGLKTE